MFKKIKASPKRNVGRMKTPDWSEVREPISFDPNKITTFELRLPDTIEKVTIKMGGRTVEFDVNTFMNMLEGFK